MIARPTRHANRAVVLIVVLWTLVILTAMCLALHTLVRSRARQTGRQAAEFRHDQAVRSAIVAAQRVLAADGRDVDCLSDPWASGTEATFSGRLNGGEYLILLPRQGSAQWGLTDEAARLNANTATVEMLTRLPRMTPAAVDAFIAAREALAVRIDAMAGDLVGPAAGLTGPIADRDQLGRMLCAALDQPLPPAEHLNGPDLPWHMARQWPPAVAEVMLHLTVYSRAWNLDADGKPRVNLNAATIAQMTAQLGGELTPLQIQAVIQARDKAAFGSVGELLTRPMTALDRDRTVTVTIPRDRFARIVDRLTVTAAEVLPGRVNVNTAGADVLACLPGMAAGVAADLIDHRAAMDPQQLRSVGWLLDVLTDVQFEQIVPHVTTRSGQFSMVASSVEAGSTVAVCVRAILERRGGRNAVLHLERYRRIWDDPR